MNVKKLVGRTQFSAGEFLGYVLWKQSDGVHLSWTSKGKKKSHLSRNDYYSIENKTCKSY